MATTLRGHKVFVSVNGDMVSLEAVTDDRPLTRILFSLSPNEAEDIATMLLNACSAIGGPDA